MSAPTEENVHLFARLLAGREHSHRTWPLWLDESQPGKVVLSHRDPPLPIDRVSRGVVRPVVFADREVCRYLHLHAELSGRA